MIPKTTRQFVNALLLAAAFLVVPEMNAQLKSITTVAEYSSTLSKRLDVQDASAVGGGVDITYAVAGNFNIGLRAGYLLYSINQTDQLNRWGWTFWNDRYLNKIQSDMRADPSLSAVIGSVQKMDAIPVALHCDYTIDAAEKLTIVPTVAAGVTFYSRRLFADETWTKIFPAAAYSFTYNFRNFAPTKKGSPLFGSAGVAVRYRLFSDVGVVSSVNYTQYIATTDSFGYTGFPFDNECSIKLGLEFLY